MPVQKKSGNLLNAPRIYRNKSDYGNILFIFSLLSKIADFKSLIKENIFWEKSFSKLICSMKKFTSDIVAGVGGTVKGLREPLEFI